MARAKKAVSTKYLNFTIESKSGKTLQIGFTAINPKNKEYPKYNQIHEILQELEAGHSFQCKATVSQTGKTTAVSRDDLDI